MKGRVVVIDDDQSMCEMIEAGLRRKDFDVTWRTSAREAESIFRQEEYDVVLTDLQMPGEDGLELCRRLVRNRPDIPVVVVTAFGSMESAVAALRAGAYDFVSKPFDLDTLSLLLSRAVNHRRLLERIRVLSETVTGPDSFDGLIGASPAMKHMFDLMKRIADTDSSVLIVGESGTGKELVARSLHRTSRRKEAPFVALNCSAIPETLLESELFGHRKGAFTDARADREGLFVQAHGGTLLLDEIGDLPLSLQPKLLRAIEERSVRPLGDGKEVGFDVRIIASTNRDLETMVAEGSFREDLFYRFNVIQIALPPLRSRGNDTLLLAERFLKEFASVTGKNVIGLAAPVAHKLLSYLWPGNVRQLRNCIEHAVALTHHDKLVMDDLPAKIAGHTDSHLIVMGHDPQELVPMDELERRYITHVLAAAGGNKTTAAGILGMDRKTLYRKLDRYGIAIDAPSAED
jgi:two-component system response regulator HydG